MEVDGLYLEYENRIDSFRKTDLLPRRGRFVIDALQVRDGEAYLIDHTLPGPYRLRVRQINLEDAKLDLSMSAHMLFNTRRGRAALGRGLVLAHSRGETGSFLLKNVDWGSVIGWEHLPFVPGTAFSLVIHHNSLPGNRMQIRGSLHLLGLESHRETDGVREPGGGIPFDFQMNLDDYRLTMDLGIQRFVEQIFLNARPRLIERGLLFVGKEIFDRFKKSETGPS